MEKLDHKEEEKSRCLSVEDNVNNEDNRKNTWPNKVEFILSLFGYTSGISDFWRFPYLTWRNGGGAFVIAFICSVVIFGIPLYFMELVVSQYSGKSIYEVWSICPLLKGVGLCVGILNIIYLGYGSVSRLWLVDYMVTSFTGLPWSSCNNTWNTNSCITSEIMFRKGDFYLDDNRTANITMDRIDIGELFVTSEEEFWQHKVLDLSKGIDKVGDFRWSFCIYSFLLRVIVILVVIKNVKSIGKAMYVLTVLPILLVTAIWIRSLLLPGAIDGIKMFFIPEFKQLASIRVWIEAVMMSFYTLGPAWGGLITVGSHSKFHNNCLRAAIISCTADTVNGIYCSVVLFSVLGVAATGSGIELEQIVKAGMSVGLVGYSRALSYLPFPHVWTILFFVSVCVAIMDVQVLCQEVIISFIQEVFPSIFRHRRFIVVIGTSVLVFLISLPFCTQGGPYMIHILDWYHATLPILIFAVLECITFMWIYGGDKLNTTVRLMMDRNIPHLIRISVAFISPILLIILIISSLMIYKPPTYGSYTYPSYVEAIGWSMVVFTVLPVPMYILYQYVKHPGPPKKRIACMIKPQGTWVLKDEVRERYNFTNRFIDRLKFNLTGRHMQKVDTVEVNCTTPCFKE